jgi:hypothetical protein
MARRRTASQCTIRLELELPSFLESLICRFVQHPHQRNLLVFCAQTNRIHEVLKNLVANFDVVFPADSGIRQQRAAADAHHEVHHWKHLARRDEYSVCCVVDALGLGVLGGY